MPAFRGSTRFSDVSGWTGFGVVGNEKTMGEGDEGGRIDDEAGEVEVGENWGSKIAEASRVGPKAASSSV